MSSSPAITIAIDAMGGDHGPRVTVPATLRALSFLADTAFVLVGREAEITPFLPGGAAGHDRLTVLDVPDVVTMEDKPSSALRHKRDSSLYRAIELLAQGDVSACVSAGNTGALVAMGYHLLGTFDGIDRPAICAAVPTHDKPTLMLDVGASPLVQSHHLHQFAVMGTVLAQSAFGVQAPRVALLNMGTETIKGSDLVKQAASLCGADPGLNFTGFIEADQVFAGAADVVVCDGFSGNIALKSAEGAARLIRTEVAAALSRSVWYQCVAWLLKPLLGQVSTRIDPARYNGASLLGLRSTLVKSHGNADVAAFVHAIELARVEGLGNIPLKIQQQLHAMSAH